MPKFNWTTSNLSTSKPVQSFDLPENTAVKRRRHTLVYKFADFCAALLAWALFFIYRAQSEGAQGLADIATDPNFWYGLALVPVGWILFYEVFDHYRDIYRLSRAGVLARTFFLSLFGVLFLFFTLILDDFVFNYRNYYASFAALFVLHFLLTAVSRMTLLSLANRRLRAGEISYNTLIIGGNMNAVDLYLDITGQPRSLGYRFLGFIDTNGSSTNELRAYLPCLGKLGDLPTAIRNCQAEEVIIAVETSEHNRLRTILNALFDFTPQVLIKIIPDMYDILLGAVKMNQVYGAVLIEIEQELMPLWQKICLCPPLARPPVCVYRSPGALVLPRPCILPPGTHRHQWKTIPDFQVPLHVRKRRGPGATIVHRWGFPLYPLGRRHAQMAARRIAPVLECAQRRYVYCRATTRAPLLYRSDRGTRTPLQTPPQSTPRYHFLGAGEIWLCIHRGRNDPAPQIRYPIY